MPNTQSRREGKFAKYDAMSTEELQQLLREDASKSEGEESDTEVLFYVMDVLAKRRKARNEGKSPEEAWESFLENYYTDDGTPDDSEDAPVPPQRSVFRRWMKGLIAAAAMLVVLIGGSATAKAMGGDLWRTIVFTTKEAFHFRSVRETTETVEPVTVFQDSFESIQEALDQFHITTSPVPTWIPEGYVESEVVVTQIPKRRAFKVDYQSGEKLIVIRIGDYVSSYPTQFERSGDLIEIYESNGVEYYIFPNYDILNAVWINENFECSISGPVTLEEMERMIDSIGKE